MHPELAKALSSLLQPTAAGITLGEATSRYVAQKARLAPETHRTYKNILDRLARDLGPAKPLASLTALDLDTWLATMPPGAAHNCCTRIRAWQRWCHRLGLTWQPILPSSPHTAAGFPPWTKAELAAYRKRWPSGTKQRLIFEVALATGLRRADLPGALWGMPNNMARLKTQKTGEVVWLPALTACRQAFPANLGRRMKPTSLGARFRTWCNAAGVRKSLHGLRKTLLETAAEAGCSGPELMVLAGHTSLRMTSHYIRGLDRAKLAQSALEKLLKG